MMKATSHCDFRRIAAAVVAALVVTAGGLPGAPAAPAWHDNDEPFKDEKFGAALARLNMRRSGHFRILWGDGTLAGEENLNAELGDVTEQLVQGNLQMLEQAWELMRGDPPQGVGFTGGGESNNPERRDGRHYRTNLIMNQAGLWTGGAWGSCDGAGLPMFALPVSYLRWDPPSGATPHEFGHTVLINAGGFNDTPYDGMWHEAGANWVQLQFNDSYPLPGFAVQPYLSLPHGRNYYDAWMIFEALREDPRYGYAFISRLWREANGSRAKGAEYIFDAMARLDTSGSPDGANAIRDMLGTMAAKCVTWDYQRGAYWHKAAPRTRDPFTEIYRRGYTELVRRNGDPKWFRVPFSDAPSQGGFNIVPVELAGKTGGGYRVGVDLRPLEDPLRGTGVRATLVAVSDDGHPRYSAQWSGGLNTITLAADENLLYLVVAATPRFMGYEGFSHPLLSDLPLQPHAWEVAFVGTKATAWESKPQAPAGVAGKPHPNGGGFVADTARAEASAFVGPHALVLDRGQVLGQARIEDHAIVRDEAQVRDRAVVSGHGMVKDRAQVFGDARVRDWATVGGPWQVFDHARVLERAWLMGNEPAKLRDHAAIKGVVCDYAADVSGHAIKEGDCANGVPVSKQVLMCWVWGADQKYADEQPDCEGLYCNFRFDRPSPIFARDHYGLVHGYLMGGPEVVAPAGKAPGHALRLNGSDQYVELRKDVADFNDTTIAAWVCPDGGEGEQCIVHFGDGADKYLKLLARAANGKSGMVISTSGKAGEQVLVGPPLPAGAWTHVAVTLDGDTGTLFLNGREVARNTALTIDPFQVMGPNTLAGTNAMFLGRGAEGGWFKGMLADFRVYSLPQDPALVAKLAAAIERPMAGAKPAPRDTTPPQLPGRGFLQPPTVVGADAVAMSAPPATDDGGQVEYLFACVDEPARTSGWIASNRWTECGVPPGQAFRYAFTVRDAAGNALPPCEPVAVSVPPLPPLRAAFAEPPRGIAPDAIRMLAARPPAAAGPVEFRFVRGDGKAASGWQASPEWTDRGVEPGARHSYVLGVRSVLGDATAKSAPHPATARDATPPARFPLGDWSTRPVAMLDNSVFMRARSVTGADGEPAPEAGPVEYSFHCAAGDGPDSGWQADHKWQTPPLADGRYVYQYKLRDAAGNETPLSAPQAVTVSARTGYHRFPPGGIARLEDDTLVTFQGAVSEVKPDAYVVSADGAKITVVPRTPGRRTDPALAGKTVTVKGAIRTSGSDKLVTWADLDPTS